MTYKLVNGFESITNQNFMINLQSECTKNMIFIIRIFILFLFVYWIIKKMKPVTNQYTETFVNNNGNNKLTDLKQLHDVLTSNCSPKYCNATSWGEKVQLPDNHFLTNISTNGGCCVIPNELRTMIYSNRGNNV